MKLDPAVFTPWHYTSENCAMFLKKYLKNNASVLDVGTGSGILALMARKYGAGRILAVDVQQESVDLASENCAGKDIEVRKDYLNWNVHEKFDITIANLYQNAAAEFLQYAKNTMADDGILILTWPAETSSLMIEEFYDIIERTTGQPFNTFVLKLPA